MRLPVLIWILSDLDFLVPKWMGTGILAFTRDLRFGVNPLGNVAYAKNRSCKASISMPRPRRLGPHGKILDLCMINLQPLNLKIRRFLKLVGMQFYLGNDVANGSS